jgi:hypothetical protein
MGKNSLVITSVSVLGLLLLAGIAYLGLLRVDTYLKDKAIDECSRLGTYQKRLDKESATVTYPLEDVYQKCLKDKGITLSQ